MIHVWICSYIYLFIPTVSLIDLGKQHSTVYTSQTSLSPKAAPIATAAAFSVDKTEEDEDPDSLSDSEEVDFFLVFLDAFWSFFEVCLETVFFLEASLSFFFGFLPADFPIAAVRSSYTDKNTARWKLP